MPDEILLPQVPEAKPDDPEDVSWALSTAEAMWARGEHLEGIKWVRRAAEAASEAEDDMRALELAKAAADLTGLISRMSKASPDEASAASAPPPARSAPPPPVRSSPPPAVRSAPPPPLAPTPAVPNVMPGPGSVTRQVATPSRPPVAPLASKQQAPRPLAVTTRSAAPGSPSRAPAAPGSSPRDARGSAPRPPAPPPVPTSDRPSMNANATDTSPLPVQQAQPVQQAPQAAGRSAPPPPVVQTQAGQYPIFPRRADSDATVIAHVSELDGELRASGASERSTDDFGDTTNPGSGDGPDTANGFSTEEADTDRKTRLGSAPPPRAYAPDESLMGGGAGVAGGMPAASPAPTANRAPAPRQDPPHDPNLLTSQAVRVVVWRDASGVHVAPAGTVVSAIKVDAVLVALEPNADLTAWLSQRSR